MQSKVTVVQTPSVDEPALRLFVMLLFFIFGGITSLNDVLIPKLKELFVLDYAQAMLVQSAFFTAYLVVSVPAAAFVKRIGYMRSAVAGLATMMIGCLFFVPASFAASFGLFLFALFVLASGVTLVQVVANPLISLLGPAATTHSRLTFAQAFNSLGTTIFPYVGSLLFLGGLASVTAADLSGAALEAHRAAETLVVAKAYLGLAVALFVVAVAVWLKRNQLQGERHDKKSLRDSLGVLKQFRFSAGVMCIFLYVGAEVSIGSLIVSYLKQAHVLALGDQAAGKLISFYWAGALIGRFVGSAIMRAVSPGKMLATNASAAIALIVISANTTGPLAAYSLLAIGLMNSIMFPTIFALACEGLGKKAADGSGIICVAIVGGAVIPPLTGYLADVSTSLSIALALPALCYAIIALFGIYARHQVSD